MKNWILLVGIMFSLNSFGQNNNISELELIGCWTDSREENKTDSELNIYRPCEFKTFPPSRYRFTMELKANQKCSWLYLAPNDAHHMVDGTWAFNKESGILEIIDLQGSSMQRFIVIGLEKNLMKIENFQ